ncbi:MAG: hypothetical protein IPO83_10245 [Chitinophagaceae bacterium]|nr:hypothetical protein [Chitinophagaceae bacterium]
MKYTLTLFIFLLPVITIAQTGKAKSDTALINDLISSWNVGLHEDGNEAVNIRGFNKFKELFWRDATVDDEIDATFHPMSSDDPAPYKTSTKTFEFYAHDLALHFRNIKIEIADITYDRTFNAHDTIINVTLTKTTSGEKLRQYVFDADSSRALALNLIKYKYDKQSIEIGKDDTGKIVAAIRSVRETGSPAFHFIAKNTMLIQLRVKNDTMKINSIRITATAYDSCTNDADNDGVIDEEDNCKEQRGDLTANGCTDSDLDEIADTEDDCDFIYGSTGNNGCPSDFFVSNFDITEYVGFQLNSTQLNMPEPDQLGYNEVDLIESQKGSLSNPGFSISPVIGVDLSYFFGKRKKNFGISIGANYTKFTTTYEVTAPAVYVFKSNDGTNDYRRVVTLEEGSKEDLTYRIADFPLYFKYRKIILPKDPARFYKWEIEFSAGPSFMLFTNSSKYNSTVDFEGLYQVDSINKNDFTYYNNFDYSSTWNVFMTADSINAQSQTPGAQAVFDMLNEAGYDFASGKKYNGETKNFTRSNIAFHAKFDACYNFNDNDRFAFKFGANVVFAPMADKSSGYTFVDKTTDAYKSIYEGNAKSNYFAFGASAGLVFRW